MVTTTLSPEEKKVIKKLLSFFKTFGRLLRLINEAKGKDSYEAMGAAHAIIAQMGHPAIVGVFFEVKALKDESTDPDEYRFFRRWQWEVECRMHEIAWEEASYGPAYQLRNKYTTITKHRELFNKKDAVIPSDLEDDAEVPVLPGSPGLPDDYATKEWMEEQFKKVKELFDEKLSGLAEEQKRLINERTSNILSAVTGIKPGLTKVEMTEKINELVAALSGSGDKPITITGANPTEIIEGVERLLGEFEQKVTVAIEKAAKNRAGGLTKEELEELLKDYLTRDIHQRGQENLISSKLDEYKRNIKDELGSQLKYHLEQMPKPASWGWNFANTVLIVLGFIGLFVFMPGSRFEQIWIDTQNAVNQIQNKTGEIRNLVDTASTEQPVVPPPASQPADSAKKDTTKK